MKLNNEFICEYLKGIVKPGSVLVSYGMRGGGKTHCAVSFCQRIMEGYFPGLPKHVILITNVIFVKRTESGFVTESPPGVYTIHTMKDIFPIIVETLEKYGRKDTMVILLLDEAQNFLLGDMNNVGDMASSMKKFCGIIRKFNLCLWLLSPAMRNLGPAFRNFLDAENDPGNVNCTFQKNNARAKRFIEQRHYDMDPRSIVYVKAGFNEPTELLPVPTSSWTRDPDTMKIGEYAYDNLSSADFTVGEFPFHDFVTWISGRSSYEMIPAIKEFYASLPEDEGTETPSDGRMTEEQWMGKWFPQLRDAGVSQKLLCEVFHHDHRQLKAWAAEASKREGDGTETRSSPPRRPHEGSEGPGGVPKHEGGGVPSLPSRNVPLF